MNIITFQKGQKTMRPQKSFDHNEPVELASQVAVLHLHKIGKLQTEIDQLKIDVKMQLDSNNRSDGKRQQLLELQITELRAKNDDLQDEILDLKDENQSLLSDWHGFIKFLSQAEQIAPEWRSPQGIAQLESLWRESEESESKAV
jgi:predicted RNase H-like nuclease (RuvC/YqgF family)